MKRLVDDMAEFRRVLHQIIMLGAMAGETDRVRFLKGVSADQVRRNLTGKNDHWDAVHQCVRDAGNGIGRARPGCDEHDTRLPGLTGVALCRMSGRLLMAHKHMLDRWVLKKVVVNGLPGLARRVA